MSFWDKFLPEGTFDYQISNIEVIENVKKAGYEVLEAQDNQLFLDLDTEEQFKNFCKLFDKFKIFFDATITLERFSISGPPHKHIVIKLDKPMSISERVAWQAILGSDPEKEFNNLLGPMIDIPHKIVLFNKKRGTPKRNPVDDDIPF